MDIWDLLVINCFEILEWKNTLFTYFRICIARSMIKCTSKYLWQIKTTQINYVSRNQLHHTENLNFGLMCKKAKHCRALSTNFYFLFSWLSFLIMFCFLLNWRKNSNYFKIAVWRSDSTELRGIYLYENWNYNSNFH